MGLRSVQPSLLMAVIAALLPSACVAPAPTAPSASPVASLAPSAQPSALQASHGASVAPSSAPSAAPARETTTMRGKVYDEAGTTAPDGSRVTVRSLEPSAPFETVVETRGGSYVVNQAPVGVALEITADREGWTRRMRVEVLRSNTTNLERRNVFNFGGAQDANDPSGYASFISSYPEIERVEPVGQSTSLSNQSLSFRLVMSEPLDVANQRRLASAFLIVPNNQEGLADDMGLPADSGTVDPLNPVETLRGLRAGATPMTTSAYRYRQNSGFLNGALMSDFKWESDNRTATFTLNAPIKTGKENEAQYAFLLVQQDDQPVQDGTGKPLGTDVAGKFGNTARNGVIYHALKETDVSLGLNRLNTPEERWVDTHTTYSTFSVERDAVAPQLVSVTARRNYADDVNGASDRIELTFSEPMMAYPRISGSELLSLNNYVLAAANTQAAIDVVTLLDDGSATGIPPGASFADVRSAIQGAKGGVVESNSNQATGSFSAALSVNDPKVVVLSLPAGALPLEANFIKVFVGSDANTTSGVGKPVTDPAGNPVDVNRRVAVGSIL